MNCPYKFPFSAQWKEEFSEVSYPLSPWGEGGVRGN